LQLLESVFHPKIKENTFLEIKLNFSLIEKCFSLINFLIIKKNRKVWKVVYRKPLSVKQTRPKTTDTSQQRPIPSTLT
jgi:hypothetical protein